MIVEPSTRDDADVDYTFVQIAVGEPVADYGAMCGDLSSAVGPFAVDEGLVRVDDGQATVRVYNTNTDKLYRATFAGRNGRAIEAGDFEIPGVSGTGAKIKLDYLDPGGAATGSLLPTGRAVDRLDVPDVGPIEASLVDASNPVAFVRASDLSRTGLEAPAALDADTELMARLDAVRRTAAVAMGLSNRPEDALLSTPKIAMVAPPGDYTALDGRSYTADAHDIAVRLVSMGNVHRAVALTGAMCLATAVRVPDSIPHALARPSETTLIGNPSGLLPVAAEAVIGADGSAQALSATTYRTQRRVMEGAVLFPEALLKSAA